MEWNLEQAAEEAVAAVIEAQADIAADTDITVRRFSDHRLTTSPAGKLITVVCDSVIEAKWSPGYMCGDPVHIQIVVATPVAHDNAGDECSTILGYVRKAIHRPVTEITAALNAVGNGLFVFNQSARVGDSALVPIKDTNIRTIALSFSATML